MTPPGGTVASGRASKGTRLSGMGQSGCVAASAAVIVRRSTKEKQFPRFTKAATVRTASFSESPPCSRASMKPEANCSGDGPRSRANSAAMKASIASRTGLGMPASPFPSTK